MAESRPHLDRVIKLIVKTLDDELPRNKRNEIFLLQNFAQKLWNKLATPGYKKNKNLVYSPMLVQANLYAIAYCTDAKYLPGILNVLYDVPNQDIRVPNWKEIVPYSEKVDCLVIGNILYISCKGSGGENFNGVVMNQEVFDKLCEDHHFKLIDTTHNLMKYPKEPLDYLEKTMGFYIGSWKTEKFSEIGDPEFNTMMYKDIVKLSQSIPWTMIFICGIYFKPKFTEPFYSFDNRKKAFVERVVETESSSSENESTSSKKIERTVETEVKVLRNIQEVLYQEFENAKAIELEIEDEGTGKNISMLIIVSESKPMVDDYENLQQVMTRFYPNGRTCEEQNLFSEFRKTMRPQWLDLWLPQFKIIDRIRNLRKVLIQMGVQYIFDKQNDPFTKITCKLEAMCADILRHIVGVNVCDVQCERKDAEKSYEGLWSGAMIKSFKALSPFFFAIFVDEHVFLNGIVGDHACMIGEFIDSEESYSSKAKVFRTDSTSSTNYNISSFSDEEAPIDVGTSEKDLPSTSRQSP